MQVAALRIPVSFGQRADAIGARLLGFIVLASVPAMLVDVWIAGGNLSAGVDQSWLMALADGASLWLPHFCLAVLISLFWGLLFSRSRIRPLDPGWLYCAWFYVLLLPPDLPLPLAAFGLSFGLLFGCHAFGGTGKYVVNPALLGAVFVGLAWPEAVGSPDWGRETTYNSTMLGAILCLAGALLLRLAGLGSWRVLIGAVAALLLTAWLSGNASWQWQPLLGHFALVLAFLALDPTTQPESHAGQWFLGLAYGGLTTLLRSFHPEQPEASLQALLLASVAVPLVDQLSAVRRPVAEGD